MVKKKQPSSKRASMCLVMIVKNESKVIKRCIDSVKDYIDYWVICDTGSTDGTQDLIKNLMKEYKIKGELHEREWKDYGTNRTESLELSKGKCDYRLIIDADDFLDVQDPENLFVDLTEDSYKIKIQLGAVSYYRTQIIKSDQDWKYIGVLHEYLEGPSPEVKEGFIENAQMIAAISGDKREGITPKEKYYNDALVFKNELDKNPNLDEGLKTRYQFYLAQSYRDAEMYEEAIEEYQKRADMGAWPEEVYISLYMIAKIKLVIGRPEEDIINSFLKAWEYRPIRLEAPYNLIRYLVSRKRYFLGFVIASTCMRMQACEDILFVEADIWSWKMADEYSVLAFYTGNIKEAYNSCNFLIKTEIFNQIEVTERERILKNFEIFQKIYDQNLEREKEIKDLKPETVDQ